MNVSTEYKMLKNIAKFIENKVVAYITPDLALELLSRAKNCSPINWVRATEMAFAYLSETFDASADLIKVFEDNDELCSGVQRLAGIVLSGLPSVRMYFVLEERQTEKFKHVEITPEAAQDILTIKPSTANRYVNKRKEKEYVQAIKNKEWGLVSFKPTKKPKKYNRETLLEFYRSNARKEPKPQKAIQLMYEYLASHEQLLKDYLTLIVCVSDNPAPRSYWHKPNGVYSWMATFAGSLSPESRRFFSPEQLKELSELSVGHLIALLPPAK